VRRHCGPLSSHRFGYAFDFALATVVAAVAIPLIALIVALLMTIVRRLPRMATGMMVGSCFIASSFASVPPPLKEKFTKLNILDSEGYNKDWEPVFQTIRAPLAAFSRRWPVRQPGSPHGAAEVRSDRQECDLRQRGGI
jgi:hypothetical protein